MAQQLLRHAQGDIDDDEEEEVDEVTRVDVDFNNNNNNHGDGDEGASGVKGGGGGSGSGGKAGRLPRWTRQEILVLIQGKRVAENRVKRGRSAALCEQGQAQVIEPKWATVSSYCKRHGVNRGPVQCRKRWSNLAGDFKKIKEWESQIKDDSDSFWLMRNDVRRERKLPGFFDREVFDILSNSTSTTSVTSTTLSDTHTQQPTPTAVFDSGRSAAADDGLFSDFEQQLQAQDTTPGDQTHPKAPNTNAEVEVQLHLMSAPPMVSPIPAPTPISGMYYLSIFIFYFFE